MFLITKLLYLGQSWNDNQIPQKIKSKNLLSVRRLNTTRIEILTASSLQSKVIGCSAECSAGRCDERFRIPGRDGRAEDDTAQNEDGVREEPERHEDTVERAVVRRTDPGEAGQEPDHRRGPSAAVRRAAVRSPNHSQGSK